MQTQQITMTRHEARGLYRSYKKHLHYSKPIDRECMRAYQLLGQGRLIIKALESVVAAGLNADGLPKLAICRADAIECHLALRSEGSATMTDSRSWWRRKNAAPSRWIDFPRGSFPSAKSTRDRIARLPSIPLHLRPQRGLANYHLLWEAEWTKIPPSDPFLLRRIGQADLWLVVAMSNLTEVERAALSTRLTNG
jgi:hypothetical protein